MASTAPSTKRLESSTPSETAIRWPTTELLLSSKAGAGQGASRCSSARTYHPRKAAGGQASQSVREGGVRGAKPSSEPAQVAAQGKGEKASETSGAQGAKPPSKPARLAARTKHDA